MFIPAVDKLYLLTGSSAPKMLAHCRYFFSWRDPALKGIEEDWLGARNYCRKRCMDSVSLETSNENEWIKRRLVDDKVSDRPNNAQLTMSTLIDFHLLG